MSSEEEEEEGGIARGLIRTLLYIHQIPGEKLKTPPDTLPCAQPFTRYSQFGTCWYACVHYSRMGMYYKKW